MKIGLVEEDSISVDVLKMFSKQLGWDVVYESKSYQQWIQTPPDDSNMPELFFVNLFFSGVTAGLAIGTWIRTFTNSKLVFISTIVDPQTLSFAEQLRPDGFLQKPIYKHDLQVLAQSLELSKSA